MLIGIQVTDLFPDWLIKREIPQFSSFILLIPHSTVNQFSLMTYQLYFGSITDVK